MPRTTITTIPAPKRSTSKRRENEFEAHKRREAVRARARATETVRSDGVTRCTKCPPKSCCPTCSRINNGRQIAGLIRPRGSPEPHPNNCLPCIPSGHKYVGQRPMPKPRAPRPEIVSMDIRPLGGGWYEGCAYLGLEQIYASKFRSRDAARHYAVNAMVLIKDGLKFEELLNG